MFYRFYRFYKFYRFCKFFSGLNLHAVSFFFLFTIFCTLSSATAREISLSWDANSEPNLSHYIVYWGLSSGDYADNSGNIGLVTEYTVEIPDDGRIYFFAVTAVDTSGLESDYSNEVNTSSLIVPPVANAGVDQNVEEGQQVVLDGSKSYDPDGNIVSWRWIQTEGSPVDLNNQSTAYPVFNTPFVNPQGETLTFMLTVTDSQGLSKTDTCIVNILWINDPPVSDAGANQNVEEGQQVVLDGSKSFDHDGSIVSWEWTQTGGTQVILNNSGVLQQTFISPSVDSNGETLTFKLTVTDSEGLKSSAVCNVNVAWVNDPPVAVAGADQNVEEGKQVVLDGSKSFDHDGTIVNWSWTQTAGTPVDLINHTTAQPAFNTPFVNQNGESLTFELTVKDALGLVDKAFCIVNVVWVNDPPVSHASPDQNATSGESIILDGSGSNDPDGKIISYHWIQTGGTTVSLDNQSAVKTVFEAPYVGPEGDTLSFKLVVTDDGGLQASSEHIVTINPSILSVKSGWNLVSIPSDSQTSSIEDTFGPILDDIISIWSYDNGKWLAYNPENPYASTLFSVEPGKGLWVNMKRNANLAIVGFVPADTVDLSKGWNLVGYNLPASKNISEAISSIAKNIKSVWAFKNGEWKVYDPNNPLFSDLETMEPGSGYWINVKSSCLWAKL